MKRILSYITLLLIKKIRRSSIKEQLVSNEGFRFHMWIHYHEYMLRSHNYLDNPMYIQFKNLITGTNIYAN